VGDLLAVDFGAVGVVALQGLAQDWVELRVKRVGTGFRNMFM
jgi:hypothetical protein